MKGGEARRRRSFVAARRRVAEAVPLFSLTIAKLYFCPAIVA